MRGNWQYHMQVLTPLHIGSGQALLPFEYVTDKNLEQVVRVDIPRFFRLPGFPVQKYTAQVNRLVLICKVISARQLLSVHCIV